MSSRDSLPFPCWSIELKMTLMIVMVGWKGVEKVKMKSVRFVFEGITSFKKRNIKKGLDKRPKIVQELHLNDLQPLVILSKTRLKKNNIGDQ